MKGRELLFIIKARNAARGVLNQFRKNLKGISTAAKAATTAFNRMGKSVREVGAQARAAAKALRGLGQTRGVTSATAGFRRMRQGIANTLKEALTLRGVLAGFGAAFVLRGAFTTLVGFSDEMAKVRAISGATTEQFEAMKNKAAELGTTTRFTAVQAAEGMTFLSRAGFTAAQSIEAISSTLDLAQAGALDLGRAADIVSNVMTAFGIDTARTSDAVDVLAVVANSSNTSIEQLGDAMKFAAPLSAALGISLQETAAAIGALGNAGIQGGAAGAGLQIFLSKLVNLKDSSREAFEVAGVNLKKLNPLTNSLADILDALANSSFGAAEAIEAFGARGLRTVLSLLKQRDTFTALTEKQKEAAGAAREFARIMDDQLGGAVKAVVSAFSGLVIAFGEAGFINVLEGLIRGIASVVRIIAGFLTSISKVVKAIPGLTTALKTLGIVIGVLAAAGGIPLLILGFIDFAAGSGLATSAVGGFIKRMTIGPIIIFGTAVKAGAANFIKWSGAAKIAAAGTNLFKLSLLGLLSPIKTATKAFGAVKLFLSGLGGGALLGRIGSSFTGVITIAKDLASSIAGPLRLAFAGISVTVLAVVAAVGALAFGLFTFRNDVLETSQGMVSLKGIFVAIGSTIATWVSDTVSAVGTFIVKISDAIGITDALAAAADSVTIAWKAVGNFFTDDLPNSIRTGMAATLDFLFTDEFLARAAAMQDAVDFSEEDFGGGSKVIDRLGSAVSEAEAATAELQQEFLRVKDAVISFIAVGNPMIGVLKGQADQLKKVGDLTRFTDTQLERLGITQAQIPAILARSKQAMEDELRPLRLLNMNRTFEISLIGKSKLAIAQETLVRENRLAVFRGEQLADAKRLTQAKALLAIQAQARAAEGGQNDIASIRQKISLIGLEGVALRERQLAIKEENALRKEGVTITDAQRRALLALQEIQAQDKFNEKIRERLRDLKLEADLIGLTGIAREVAAAQQDILNEATRKGLNLTLANAQATAVGAAIILNSQKEFRAEFEESLRKRQIEAALIGRSTEEIQRLEVAMEAMREAKRAGFSTKEIQEFGRRAVEAFDKIKEAQDRFQSDGLNGFKKAMDDYIAESKRFADQYESLMKNALGNVEDALADFITTGKVDFRSLLTSISKDLAKISSKAIVGKITEALRGPVEKKTPGGLAGVAGELLGPDAQEDPIIKATKEAAQKLRESGGLISVELKLGAEKTKIAFDLVKQATESAAQISANTIRMAGQELADAIRSAAVAVREAGQDTGKPGVGEMRERAEVAREAESVFGDAPLLTEEDLAPLKENIAFQADAFGSILSASNDNYAKAFTNSVDGFGFIAGEWEGQMGGALDGLVKTISSLAQQLFSSSGGGGGGGGGVLGGIFSSLFSSSSGNFQGLGSFADFAFAKGGIMSARGAVKLRHYADGGVAKTPQLAVFGEGDQPEAFVPLPDGRRIPVEMSGPPTARPVNITVNQTITTPNPAEFGRNQDQIARKVAVAFQRAMTRDN